MFSTSDYRLCITGRQLFSTDRRLSITNTLLFSTDNVVFIMGSLFFSRRTSSPISAACSARWASCCPSLRACSARPKASFPRRTHGLHLGQQFLRDEQDTMSRAESGRRSADLVCNKHQLLWHSIHQIVGSVLFQGFRKWNTQQRQQHIGKGGSQPLGSAVCHVVVREDNAMHGK